VEACSGKNEKSCYRFGPDIKFWVVLVAVPHTLAVILWEVEAACTSELLTNSPLQVGCAATIVRMVSELPEAGLAGEMDRCYMA
jgi:hypothetical protein